MQPDRRAGPNKAALEKKNRYEKEIVQLYNSSELHEWPNAIASLANGKLKFQIKETHWHTVCLSNVRNLSYCKIHKTINKVDCLKSYTQHKRVYWKNVEEMKTKKKIRLLAQLRIGD